jgi:hypothetical protein
MQESRYGHLKRNFIYTCLNTSKAVLPYPVWNKALIRMTKDKKDLTCCVQRLNGLKCLKCQKNFKQIANPTPGSNIFNESKFFLSSQTPELLSSAHTHLRSRCTTADWGGGGGGH